jgi:hypothetical protein
MKTRNKILFASIIALAIPMAYILYAVLKLREMPEAYAAWDTGVLLVEYMKSHDDHWPRSWDDLAEVVAADRDPKIVMKGNSGDPIAYVRCLGDFAKVDWTFDPQHDRGYPIVTAPDGTPISKMWEDPNQTVRQHLKDRATTLPTPRR